MIFPQWEIKEPSKVSDILAVRYTILECPIRHNHCQESNGIRQTKIFTEHIKVRKMPT